MPTARKRPKPKAKSAKSTAKRPALIPQAHPDGRKGAIYAGGVPGNRGGYGRPPSQIRAMLRESYVQRIPRVAQMADGITSLTIVETCPKCGYEPPEKRQGLPDAFVNPELSLKAIDHMAKYGLDSRTQLPVDEVRDHLRATLDVIRSDLGPKVADALIARIRPIWSAE